MTNDKMDIKLNLRKYKYIHTTFLFQNLFTNGRT